jgi:predicted aconitase
MPILNRQITPNISLYELLFTSTVNKAEILPFIEQAWSIEVDRNLTRIATAHQRIIINFLLTCSSYLTSALPDLLY